MGEREYQVRCRDQRRAAREAAALRAPGRWSNAWFWCSPAPTRARMRLRCRPSRPTARGVPDALLIACAAPPGALRRACGPVRAVRLAGAATLRRQGGDRGDGPMCCWSIPWVKLLLFYGLRRYRRDRRQLRGQRRPQSARGLPPGGCTVLCGPVHVQFQRGGAAAGGGRLEQVERARPSPRRWCALGEDAGERQRRGCRRAGGNGG
jgi:hypothetical protein